MYFLSAPLTYSVVRSQGSVVMPGGNDKLLYTITYVAHLVRHTLFPEHARVPVTS